MSEERLNDELAAVEAALASLTPVPSNLQRDRVLFLAGLASADRAVLRPQRRLTAWLWPCATSASLLLAATFGLLWAAGRTPQIVERVVYVQVKHPATAIANSVAARPSTPFADWRAAPVVRRSGAATLPQRNPAPVRRAPSHSESGSCSHSALSVT
jgi:hypothetical protein